LTDKSADDTVKLAEYFRGADKSHKVGEKPALWLFLFAKTQMVQSTAPPKKRRVFMALSRKFLTGLGLTEAQVDAIVEGNEESLSGLKAKIDDYKTKEAEHEKKIASLQRELEDAKNLAIEKEGKNPWKVKYEALNEEFATYKTEEEKKATKAAKRNAYKALLKEAGVSDKRIDTVCKVKESDLDTLEMGEDGKFKDSENLVKNIKEEWSDFITTPGEKGAETATPPANNGADLESEHSAAKRIAAQRATLYGETK